VPFLAGPPPEPPPNVRNAIWTMRSAGYIGVLLVVATLAAGQAIGRDWHGAYARFATQNEAPYDIGGLVLACAVQAALALMLAGGIRRGRSVWRVLAWVFCGLNSLCCLAAFGLNQLFTPNAGSVPTGTALSAADRQFARDFPHWYAGIGILAGIAGILLLVSTAILLATPSSSDYFRAMTPARRVP
jgi:hypothetical protein